MAQAVLPDSQVFVLEGHPMTNTPMSEREKKLVPLVREALGALRDGTNISLVNDLEKALKPYDPKPEKEYTMPEWDELTEEQLRSIKKTLGVSGPDKFVYRDIREALSKPKAPTE